MLITILETFLRKKNFFGHFCFLDHRYRWLLILGVHFKAWLGCLYVENGRSPSSTDRQVRRHKRRIRAREVSELLQWTMLFYFRCCQWETCRGVLQTRGVQAWGHVRHWSSKVRKKIWAYFYGWFRDENSIPIFGIPKGQFLCQHLGKKNLMHSDVVYKEETGELK